MDKPIKITKSQLKKLDGLMRMPDCVRAFIHARTTLEDLRQAVAIVQRLKGVK